MFYDRFIQLCREKDVYPTIVAEKIGLNRSAATAWKKGSQPNDTTIAALADYFGVDPSYFFDGEEKNTTHKRDVLDMLAEDERTLLHGYRTMTQGQKLAMQLFVKEFRENAD